MARKRRSKQTQDMFLGGLSKKLFGGESSRSTTSQSLAPDWYKNELQGTIEGARDVFSGEFNPYTQDRFEGFAPEQEKAFGYTSDLTQDLVNREGFGNTYRDLLLGASGRTGPATGSDLESYMNPYLEATLDPTRQRMSEEYEKTLRNLAARGASAGAYGGSRYGLLEQNAANDYLRNLNELEYGARSDAFNRAQGLYDQDTDRMFGQGQALFGLDRSVIDDRFRGIDALSGVGAQRQGLGQAERDFDYSEFMRKENQGRQDYINYANLIYGAPISDIYGTKTVGPKQTGLQQISSLAGAVGDVGGAITSFFAEGGYVDGEDLFFGGMPRREGMRGGRRLATGITGPLRNPDRDTGRLMMRERMFGRRAFQDGGYVDGEDMFIGGLLKKTGSIAKSAGRNFLENAKEAGQNDEGGQGPSQADLYQQMLAMALASGTSTPRRQFQPIQMAAEGGSVKEKPRRTDGEIGEGGFNVLTELRKLQDYLDQQETSPYFDKVDSLNFFGMPKEKINVSLPKFNNDPRRPQNREKPRRTDGEIGEGGLLQRLKDAIEEQQYLIGTPQQRTNTPIADIMRNNDLLDRIDIGLLQRIKDVIENDPLSEVNDSRKKLKAKVQRGIAALNAVPVPDQAMRVTPNSMKEALGLALDAETVPTETATRQDQPKSIASTKSTEKSLLEDSDAVQALVFSNPDLMAELDTPTKRKGFFGRVKKYLGSENFKDGLAALSAMGDKQAFFNVRNQDLARQAEGQQNSIRNQLSFEQLELDQAKNPAIIAQMLSQAAATDPANKLNPQLQAIVELAARSGDPATISAVLRLLGLDTPLSAKEYRKEEIEDLRRILSKS